MNRADSIVNFEQRFGAIINTIGSQNFDELNAFISPQFGLLIIENKDGAMPQFRIQKTDDREYNQLLENMAATISYDGQLRTESLPMIDCNSPLLYTKAGSYVQDTNILSASEIWKYGNLSAEDQFYAEKAIAAIGKTVITTYGYVYYFNYYGSNWYLTVIDIRKPCNV